MYMLYTLFWLQIYSGSCLKGHVLITLGPPEQNSKADQVLHDHLLMSSFPVKLNTKTCKLIYLSLLWLSRMKIISITGIARGGVCQKDWLFRVFLFYKKKKKKIRIKQIKKSVTLVLPNWAGCAPDFKFCVNLVIICSVWKITYRYNSPNNIGLLWHLIVYRIFSVILLLRCYEHLFMMALQHWICNSVSKYSKP